MRQGDNSGGHERIHPVATLNFRISDVHGIVKGGAKQEAGDNITAILTLKKITVKERSARLEASL